MAENAPVGGLYVEVKLDAKQAVAGFDQLRAKGTQVITSLGAVSSGISNAIAREVAKSEKELQRLGEAAKQQAQVVNASFKTPKAPKTPLGQELKGLRSELSKSGISKDFLADLGSSGDLTKLRELQATLKRLQDQAAKIRVNAVDEKDIAEAEKLEAKLTSLNRAAQRQINRVSGVTAAAPRAPSPQNTSQAFNKTTQAAKQTTAAVRDTTKEFDKANGATQNVAGAALNLGANLGGIVGALKTGNIGFAVNYLFAGLARGFTSLAAVGPVAAAGILAVVGAGAAFVVSAAAVIASLKQIGTAGITAGNELQTLEIALEATLGTAGAQRELGFLTDRAQSSLFDVKGLAELDRTLLAYNVLDNDLRQGLVDTLITLGTVGGKSVDQLQFGAVALGQAFSSGVLRGTEILQLVNSLGVGLEVFRELPEYANKSFQELKQMQEQGLLPSVDLFRALDVRAASFAAVASKAAQTVSGQLAKFREDLPASIGALFLDSGVQEQLTSLLSRLFQFVSGLNFRPIAEGFATVFRQVDVVAQKFISGGGGNAIRLFIEGILPSVLTFGARLVAAFQAIGIAVRPVTDLFTRFFEAFRLARSSGQDTAQTFNPLIDAIGLFAKGLALAVQAIDFMFDNLAALRESAANTGDVLRLLFQSFRQALSGDFAGAAQSAKKAASLAFKPFIDAGAEFAIDVKDTWAEIDQAIADAKKVQSRAQTVFDSPTLGRIDVNQLFSDLDAPLSEEQAAKIKEQVDAQIKFFEDIAKKLEDARKELEGLLVRWFGFRSELEKGFLGEEGFTATADQIAATGRKVIEILRGVGQFAVAADIDRSTRRLIDLARLREQFADRLKEAEKRLDEAIQARDGFAKRIREQTIAFVNAFKLEESEVEKVTNIASNGVVGYLVSKTKETKSFVATLRDRIKTLREFRANINALAARGLDANLLEQLVAAGPEQAGDVVSQLSQSGDGVIREVNDIQRELGDLATRYGNENARRFYQAGVDTAQAQADGLRFGLKAIEFAAGLIVSTVYDQLSRLASIAGELGAAAANALARALSAGAFLGLLNVNRAADEAVRKARVVGEVSNRIGQASKSIEFEFQRRVVLAQQDPNAVARGIRLAAAEVFRAQQYQALDAEIGRLVNTPAISVFIGQEEIDAIVRTEVGRVQRQSAVAAGTRR